MQAGGRHMLPDPRAPRPPPSTHAVYRLVRHKGRGQGRGELGELTRHSDVSDVQPSAWGTLVTPVGQHPLPQDALLSLPPGPLPGSHQPPAPETRSSRSPRFCPFLGGSFVRSSAPTHSLDGEVGLARAHPLAFSMGSAICITERGAGAQRTNLLRGPG